jgi:hypothetical protein
MINACFVGAGDLSSLVRGLDFFEELFPSLGKFLVSELHLC